MDIKKLKKLDEALTKFLNEEQLKPYKFTIDYGDGRPEGIIEYGKDEEDARTNLLKTHKYLQGKEQKITNVEEVQEDHEEVTEDFMMIHQSGDGPDASGKVKFFPTAFGYEYECTEKDFNGRGPQWSTIRTIDGIRNWFRNILFEFGAKDVYIGKYHWNINDFPKNESLNENYGEDRVNKVEKLINEIDILTSEEDSEQSTLNKDISKRQSKNAVGLLNNAKQELKWYIDAQKAINKYEDSDLYESLNEGDLGTTGITYPFRVVCRDINNGRIDTLGCYKQKEAEEEFEATVEENINDEVAEIALEKLVDGKYIKLKTWHPEDDWRKVESLNIKNDKVNEEYINSSSSIYIITEDDDLLPEMLETAKNCKSIYDFEKTEISHDCQLMTEINGHDYTAWDLEDLIDNIRYRYEDAYIETKFDEWVVQEDKIWTGSIFVEGGEYEYNESLNEEKLSDMLVPKRTTQKPLQVKYLKKTREGDDLFINPKTNTMYTKEKDGKFYNMKHQEVNREFEIINEKFITHRIQPRKKFMFDDMEDETGMNIIESTSDNDLELFEDAIDKLFNNEDSYKDQLWLIQSKGKIDDYKKYAVKEYGYTDKDLKLDLVNDLTECMGLAQSGIAPTPAVDIIKDKSVQDLLKELDKLQKKR